MDLLLLRLLLILRHRWPFLTAFVRRHESLLVRWDRFNFSDLCALFLLWSIWVNEALCLSILFVLDVLKYFVQKFENCVSNLFGGPGLAALHDLARGFHQLMIEFAHHLGEPDSKLWLALKEVLGWKLVEESCFLWIHVASYVLKFKVSIIWLNRAADWVILFQIQVFNFWLLRLLSFEFFHVLQSDSYWTLNLLRSCSRHFRLLK